MVRRENPPGPTGQTVMANVAHFREAARLTFAELSRKLEAAGRPIPPLGLRRIEAGERKVDVDDLTALAVVLGVTPVRLLLPHTSSSAITGEVTGAGKHPTATLWSWALGYRSLSGDPGSSAQLRERSRPRTIRTREERIKVREQWIAGEIADLEQELSNIGAAVGREDQYAASQALPGIREQIEHLQDLDPSDDEQFAELDGDPAPPSPEELEGLLSTEDDDGTPTT